MAVRDVRRTRDGERFPMKARMPSRGSGDFSSAQNIFAEYTRTLTGEPGDMAFCHPVMVHCVAPNRDTRPRFMRIKTQVLTREGRELRDRLQRPHS